MPLTDDVVLTQAKMELMVKMDSLDKRFESLLSAWEQRMERMEKLATSAEERGDRGEESLRWMESHLTRMNHNLSRIADFAHEFLSRSFPEARAAAPAASDCDEWQPPYQRSPVRRRRTQDDLFPQGS